MQDLYNSVERIAKLNGKETTSVIALEECSELQKEITKMLREKGNKVDLMEEMADVYICLAELRHCYGITDKGLENVIIQKIVRTYARKGISNGAKE